MITQICRPVESPRGPPCLLVLNISTDLVVHQEHLRENVISASKQAEHIWSVGASTHCFSNAQICVDPRDEKNGIVGRFLGQEFNCEVAATWHHKFEDTPVD